MTSTIPLAFHSAVSLDIAFIMGEAQMPVARLLELRRGAVIRFDETGGIITITANRHPVAAGELLALGERLALRISVPEAGA